MTVEAYVRNLKEELDKLHHELKTGTYEQANTAGLGELLPICTLQESLWSLNELDKAEITDETDEGEGVEKLEATARGALQARL